MMTSKKQEQLRLATETGNAVAYFESLFKQLENSGMNGASIFNAGIASLIGFALTRSDPENFARLPAVFDVVYDAACEERARSKKA